ncbi:MAG: hypothetical protein HY738_20040, partial [Bacteroidia bacterium]|nr:hypothetical protein [Bacteroidia bacterium]
PWGRSRNPNTLVYDNTAGLNTVYRGYTGHEMLPHFVLINMNGRMYDPVLGRMLSPDNFVQSPNNPQNYNRYAYAMNNPLKYTDPDGEFIIAPITFTIDFLATVFVKGGIDPWNTKENRQAAWKEFDPTAEWSKTNKALKLDWGLVRSQALTWGYWDKSATGFEWGTQFLWKLTGSEALQTSVGFTFTHLENIGNNVEDVGYYEDRVAVRLDEDGSILASFGARGASHGHFFFGEGMATGPGDIEHDVDLFWHEFGHTYQSRVTGPTYYFKYGLPSANLSPKPEEDANYRVYINKGVSPFDEPRSSNPYKWWEFFFFGPAVAIWN